MQVVWSKGAYTQVVPYAEAYARKLQNVKIACIRVFTLLNLRTDLMKDNSLFQLFNH